MKMKHSFFLITSKSEKFSLEISAKVKNFPWLFFTKFTIFAAR